MRLRDARAIDAATLYERRKQAILLYKSGMTFLEIAPKVGVHQNTVGQWIKTWQEGGQAALKAKPGGRPKGSGGKLYDPEEKVIRHCLIDHCPDQLKLPFALWTRQAVQLLLKQRLDVEITLVSVGRYLKKWGFTPQKPLRRAYEHNDERVRIWLKEEYPAIAAKAHAEKAEIHWGDETGLRGDDVNGRSYVPKGKTPIQRAKGTPEKLNVISTETNKGTLRFMFYKETMTAQRFITFLKRLIRNSDSKNPLYSFLNKRKVADDVADRPETMLAGRGAGHAARTVCDVCVGHFMWDHWALVALGAEGLSD